MKSAPTLETERLILRANRQEDFEALAKVLGSDHAKFMGGPMTRKDAWQSFCCDIAQWPLLGHGAWAVDRRDTGKFVGQISIIKPPHFPEVEIGWVFFPQAEGRGYAYEAARAALKFAFNSLGLQTLVSYIDTRNTRSIALAERLGATRDVTAKHAYPDDDDVVFRHPKPAALA